MGLSETRSYGEDALASIVERARHHAQLADEAKQEYDERNAGIIRDLKKRFPKANERELASLVKQEKEKDLILEGIGRRQEFHARECLRLDTRFQTELAYRQFKHECYQELGALLRPRSATTLS